MKKNTNFSSFVPEQKKCYVYSVIIHLQLRYIILAQITLYIFFFVVSTTSNINNIITNKNKKKNIEI